MFKSISAFIQRNDILKNTLRDSGGLYVAGALSTALTLVQQITTASYLGSADYGRFATVLGSAALVLLLVDFRSWEAGTKLLTERLTTETPNLDEAEKVASFLILLDLLSGTIGSIVVLIFASLIATYLLYLPESVAIVRVYSIVIPFRLLATGIPSAILRLYNRFSWLSAKSVIYAVLRLVLISGAAKLGFGVSGVIVGAILGEMINVIILFFLMFRVWQSENHTKFTLTTKKPQDTDSIWSFVRQLWVSGTLKGLQTETFIPVLALLASPTQVGIFRSASDIAQLLLKLIEPVSVVIHPTVMNLYLTKRSSFARFIRQITVLLASLTWSFVVGLVILGPVVLPRLFEASYSGIVSVTIVLAVGYAINATFIWLRPAMVAANMVREQNIISIITFLVTFLTLIMVARPYGAVGGAIAMSLFLISHNLANFVTFSYLTCTNL